VFHWGCNIQTLPRAYKCLVSPLPHTNGETLVKPCILSAAKILLGEETEKKFQKIFLSDSTVRRRIDELA
jgi:hypothetical protein